MSTSGAYQTNFAGGNSDAFIAAFTSSGSLPVQLISFDAKLIDNKEVSCMWSTASEVNNDYFELERSMVNSQQSTVNGWEAIGKIKGNGTTNSVHNYQFTDHGLSTVNSEPSTIYYRLKQVDFDGTFTYSDVKVVTLDKEKNDWTVYPNPVANEITIHANNSQNSKEVLIEIYDLKGSKLFSLIQPINETQQYKIEVGTLDAGMYFLMINNKAVKFVKNER